MPIAQRRAKKQQQISTTTTDDNRHQPHYSRIVSNNSLLVAFMFLLISLESYRTFWLPKRRTGGSLFDKNHVVVVASEKKKKRDLTTMISQQHEEGGGGGGGTTASLRTATTTTTAPIPPPPPSPSVVDAVPAEASASANKKMTTTRSYESIPKKKLNIDPTKSPRDIILVHVGKAGGMAIRQLIAAYCYDLYPIQLDQQTTQQNAKKRQDCLDHYAKDPTQPLANQTRTTIHMFDLKPERLAEATTFLFSIRNPIDRVVSTYRYTHPANCHRNRYDNKGFLIPTNFGCTLLDQGLIKLGTTEYQLWVECFPNPAMEEFAQSILPPFPPEIGTNSTCRQLARNMLLGQGTSYQAIPHFHYGYQHYARNTFVKYPNKEIMVIRMEHMDQDLMELDLALGGNGKFGGSGADGDNKLNNNHFSHGSELYAPSPLTSPAVHKLCCLLQKEIQVYSTIIGKAINMDTNDLRQAEDTLRKQCGLDSGPTKQQQQSWEDWSLQCQRKFSLPLI